MRKKVWINGFEWWVNNTSREVFETEQSQTGTSFKFLTENEKKQIYNQIHYDNR
jgi:hypothetical protein